MKTSELSGPALRAFFRIAEAWELTDVEVGALLGSPRPETLADWRSGSAVLDEMALTRISLVLGIYKALAQLVGGHEQMRRWLDSPNRGPCLEGQCARRFIASGRLQALRSLRDYLDAQFEWG